MSGSYRHLIAIVFTLMFTVDTVAQGIWETSLRGRDLDGDISTFEAWYDTTLNITWLADADAVTSSGFTYTGSFVWNVAIDWLDFLNSTNYLGYNSWRFPTITPVNGTNFNYGTTYDGTSDRSYNLSAVGTPNAGITTGEMAHLHFTTLGNIGYYDFVGNPDQPGYGVSNAGPFTNLKETGYWTELEYALNQQGAWKFDFKQGYQDPDPKINVTYKAWPVHAGDIGTPAQGDINMDGVVNTADIVIVKNFLLGIVSLTMLEKAHADVYPVGGDAQITISDLIFIVRRALD